MHTTEQAIIASIRAIHSGMRADILTYALISDGFKPSRADTIVRWAIQFNKLSDET